LSAFPGLIVKKSYWRWPERDLAGNAIDFFDQVLNLTFQDAMRQIIDEPSLRSQRGRPTEKHQKPNLATAGWSTLPKSLKPGAYDLSRHSAERRRMPVRSRPELFAQNAFTIPTRPEHPNHSNDSPTGLRQATAISFEKLRGYLVES